VTKSPSPFHAVHNTMEILAKHGFVRLSEKESWGDLAPGGKYFTTRNQTAIVAFVVGEKYTPEEGGFCVMAAHTDSPCLRIKPVSKRSTHGFACVGSEWYGGLLSYTWFDRDLSIAGRALVERDDGKIESVLVNVNRPILRVPSLAIHLNRSVDEGFKVNKEQHLTAVLASEVTSVLNEGGAAPSADAAACASSAVHRHHPLLMEVLSDEIGCKPENIRDFELSMFDFQPAVIGGAKEEFIFSPRLDNLLMSYVTIESLLRSSSAADALASEANVRVVGLFDNEEVGSSSVPGAGSTFLEQVLGRIVGSTKSDTFMAAMRKSILVSADMAHSVHPNYSEFHECMHRPMMNAGLVIKNNTNQRYATTAITASMIRKAAEMTKTPIQEFVIKQDIGCGSTIGPILATSLGMRTVDVGVAQLAMHSAREMCGSEDVELAAKVLTTFFQHYAEIDGSFVGTD
jgi:aspartyl aminopeptidase